ncbi:MAG: helix-hairpin-helix domain-containing protein [Chloroflexota bacterium]
MPSEASNRTTIVAFGLAILAVIVGSTLLILSRPSPVEITIIPPEPTVTPLPTPTPEPITVYVTGAVSAPEQLVTLPAGSRVTDAIEAAGGLLDDADTVRVNLADELRDGDQVHVPSVGLMDTDPAPGITDSGTIVREELDLATPIGGTVVAINSASIEELLSLPGIGEVTAERIAAYIEENGPFTSLADLDNVSGIGPSTLEALAPLVVFD